MSKKAHEYIFSQEYHGSRVKKFYKIFYFSKSGYYLMYLFIEF